MQHNRQRLNESYRHEIEENTSWLPAKRMTFPIKSDALFGFEQENTRGLISNDQAGIVLCETGSVHVAGYQQLSLTSYLPATKQPLQNEQKALAGPLFCIYGRLNKSVQAPCVQGVDKRPVVRTGRWILSEWNQGGEQTC